MSQFKVTESNNDAAFIEDENGFDVAFVRRVRSHHIDDKEHKEACLTNGQWQNFVKKLEESLKEKEKA